MTARNIYQHDSPGKGKGKVLPRKLRELLVLGGSQVSTPAPPNSSVRERLLPGSGLSSALQISLGHIPPQTSQTVCACPLEQAATAAEQAPSSGRNQTASLHSNSSSGSQTNLQRTQNKIFYLLKQTIFKQKLF